ncbi:M15 family metallopeptidase [Actibacterium ureilyticum]|uniref:M15 family metallopeptidase n=1 Tax=Actibacterium ureilyticum TaxID=1590614 RepID=UPI000BAAA449|nr:M15 family metallopeptidase [Actibacterium ureilyticum]
MKAIPVIIGAIAVLALALIGVLVYFFVLPAKTPDTQIVFEEVDGGAVDSAARIEIERLRQQIEQLQVTIGELETRLQALDAKTDSLSALPGDPGLQEAPDFERDGPNQIIDAYAQVVLIANRRRVNKDLKIASPSYLESVFGRPRGQMSSRCESMTNERLRSKLILEDVGPIRVQLQEPAVESLKRVFEKVRSTDPDLYERINTAGSLCVRHIRGAPGRTSTHAFGLSLDLNIDGHLDTLGDGKTQLGLTILADFFINEGWYWGAAFTREDSMHFEVSRQLVEQWIEEGRI